MYGERVVDKEVLASDIGGKVSQDPLERYVFVLMVSIMSVAIAGWTVEKPTPTLS